MVEGIKWQKSSFSGGNGENCIEVGARAEVVVIRESDDPAQIITTSLEKLAAFIAGVKAGEFDHLVG
ncbi:DUF397 domain-containing protein [Streptomyces sp. Isolate_45]|uniref:DUF397 domain-containing protein n=1 Tax=Streptomyces sp. Isolate_45 TaxID=2950111 RepID=UPI002481F538|nr:DUF397 domain-containing protein [Streptomyces sp. Isolate_45]MDA5280569.1 DUF397 domain-containing protein [Streptomyces sp. Isolate_45]